MDIICLVQHLPRVPALCGDTKIAVIPLVTWFVLSPELTTQEVQRAMRQHQGHRAKDPIKDLHVIIVLSFVVDGIHQCSKDDSIRSDHEELCREDIFVHSLLWEWVRPEPVCTWKG